MAITFVGSANNASATGADVTITLPAMAQDDLVMVFAFVADGATSTSISTSGYTTASSILDTGGATPGFLLAYKLMTASPDSSVTLAGAGDPVGLVGIAMVFRGVGGDIIGPPSDTTAASGTPDALDISSSFDNPCIVIGAVSNVFDTSVGSVTNYLPSPTVQRAITATPSCTGAAAYRILTGGAGVLQDPPPWSTWDSGRWRSISVAIFPASASGQPSGRHMGGVMHGQQVNRGPNMIW